MGKIIISQFPEKIILDYGTLKAKIEACRALGAKIVCTIGSWDLLHVGHVRYLNKASEFGDILVVGVDSDRGIKLYKGPLRPIIPQTERMEMLSFQACVTFITLIDDIDDKGAWQYELIKQVPLDTFVAVEGSSYTDKQKEEIGRHCHLEIIPRQALDTSSSDIIQNVIKANKGRILDVIGQTLDETRI